MLLPELPPDAHVGRLRGVVLKEALPAARLLDFRQVDEDAAHRRLLQVRVRLIGDLGVQVQPELVPEQFLVIAAHGGEVERVALVLDPPLAVEHVEAGRRVEPRRVLHLEEGLVQRLRPLEGRGDHRDLLRDLLELRQEFVLEIADLFDRVSRSALRLRSSLGVLAEERFDHELSRLEVIELDGVLEASTSVERHRVISNSRW